MNRIELVDNSGKFKDAMEEAVIKALTACGMAAEGYAKANITKNQSVDTGQLRNSITFQVKDDENAVFIGTNIEYGAYVELGTGIHYEGGRRTPWVYRDREGNYHITRGQRAKPYLKPAITDHVKDYQTLIKENLKG